jgi:quercetin dioxygenase-like cupin family protein
MSRLDLTIARGSALAWRPSRRAGMREKRLITAAQSRHQNVVLVETDAGTEIEAHESRTSESIFVIEGRFEVVTATAGEALGPGDLCYFPPSSRHGLRCVEGPGRFLVVFAPAAPQDEPRSL